MKLKELKGSAWEIIRGISERIEEGKIYTGEQSDGSFLDPAYICIPISCEDIVPQATNPNYQSSKAFSALQTSILNTGMVFPVEVAKNPLYDPSTKGLPKPKCFSGGQDIVDVRDPELRKFYPYMVVDGTHRLLAVLYGSPMYSYLNETASQKIYQRTHGYIPCTVLEGKTEQELMSATILMNSARGDHDLMEIKDIVADMCRSGMSDQWIAQNLFLEKEAITRFKQLSGMRSAFNNENNISDAWDPVKDRNDERRAKIDLALAARRYVRKYRLLAGFESTSSSDDATDIISAAKNIGWSEAEPNMMPKTLDDNGKVFEKEIEASAVDENEQ